MTEVKLEGDYLGKEEDFKTLVKIKPGEPYRAEDVAPETRAAIVARHPRHGFKRDFTALVLDQAARKPDCHIAGHVGLGFARKIATAPFTE